MGRVRFRRLILLSLFVVAGWFVVFAVRQPTPDEDTSQLQSILRSIKSSDRLSLSRQIQKIPQIGAILRSLQSAEWEPTTQQPVSGGGLVPQDGQIDLFNGDVPYLRHGSHPGVVVASPDRLMDAQDAFETYRREGECNLSSLDLHEPIHPLCTEKDELLLAMSTGGRAGGLDAPFSPRGCDMRWFTTEEICTILERFSYVWIVGDSLMRHLTSAMHMMMRADLVQGQHQAWVENPFGDNCDCLGVFETGQCWPVEAWSSSVIWEKAPDTMKCPVGTQAMVEYNIQNEYPSPDNFTGVTRRLPTTPPSKPQAFVFGQGLWTHLDEDKTKSWTEDLTAAINQTQPWLTEPGAAYPRLFVTPNAASELKPLVYVRTQGNDDIRRFERDMGPYFVSTGIDHLGTWNLTVQSYSPDGTHSGMKADIIKAQMVLNWLDMVGKNLPQTSPATPAGVAADITPESNVVVEAPAVPEGATDGLPGSDVVQPAEPDPAAEPAAPAIPPIPGPGVVQVEVDPADRAVAGALNVEPAPGDQAAPAPATDQQAPTNPDQPPQAGAQDAQNAPDAAAPAPVAVGAPT